jgi:hypothetical protein
LILGNSFLGVLPRTAAKRGEILLRGDEPADWEELGFGVLSVG